MELHPKCRFWLGRVDGNVVRLEDGCHSDPEGVARAAKVHGRIFSDDGPWVMVELHEMPDLDPPIDEDSAAICAALVATQHTASSPRGGSV